MRLSREKINHLSHLISKHLAAEEGVSFLKEENDVRLEIVRVITSELQIDDEVDALVQQRLHSYSRKIVEGSREWEIMYRKLYEEEMNKRGRI